MNNNLQFRDFETEMKYTIDLNQNVMGEEMSMESTFYIDLNIEYKNGITKDFKIDHPDYVREDITEYNINRILLSPEEDSLVFIISKTGVNLNVRYMIETVRIK